MRTFQKFAGAVLALVVCAVSAFGQSNTGTLVGTVLDPGKAVVPGATVTVKDTQTGRERTVTTNSEGAFQVPQLDFGAYTVTITASGYSTYTATDVKIDAGREYTLNVQLSVGPVQASVTVVAGADIVNSQNAELSNTISSRQVKELPINGRNPLALLNLLPGVNATSASINGQRSSSTNYTRDGINVQDNFIRTGGFVSDRPTVDDTGEFTVITQNAGAQFGSGTTQVQLVTPRGGDKFHGALYEFNRNSKFGANSFFNNLNGLPKSFLNRNQFGGSISGPTPLPRFGEGGPAVIKKHAFFFFNYEGFRQAQTASASGTTLLAPAQNGTFTYVDPTGVTRTVNVLTGSGLTLTGANLTTFNNAGGNIRIDPVIQSRILNQLPSAGNGTFTGINLLQTVNFAARVPVTRNQVSGRFDVQINDRNALNFIYKRNTENNARNDIAFGFQTLPYVFQASTTKLYVLAYNMSPTPNLSNEVRFGYQRSEPFFNEGTAVPTNYLISVPLITNPEASFRSQGRNTDYYTLQDNGTYNWGNHAIKFGMQWFYQKVVALNFAGTTPTFTISSTSNPNTPGLTTALFPGGIGSTDLARANSLRYLLAGIVGSGSLTANFVNASTGFQLGAPAIRNLHYQNYAPYVEDQWRITPHLTLNFGLRYDLYTPLNNPDQIYLEAQVLPGQTAQQAALNPNGFYQLVGGNAGHPGDFFKADKNNFAPDLSFAWSPSIKNKLLGSLFKGGRTVIRGGIRASYNSDEYIRAPDNALLNHVGVGSTTVNVTQNGSTSLKSTLGPVPDASFFALPNNFTAPTVPTLPLPYSFNNSAQVASRFGTVFVVDPKFQVPRVWEYNIGVQREIGYQMAIELRYVGSRSNQLVRTIDYNQIDVTNNGFLADFLRAQNNCRLQGATLPGTGDPLFRCTNASFNNAIPGSQPLTVFPNLAVLNGTNGGLTNSTVIGQIQQGTPADLALIYIQNALQGNVQFLPNPNTGVANVLTNGGLFRYNAFQAEIRRRFANGFSFDVNYTFQKILADTTQETQTNVDPYLNNANLRLNYARPDYDRTHTINASSDLELPFGRGKRWLKEGLASKILGGFQLTSIFNVSSGAPITIRDASRGTLNRAGRSALQPATSTLTVDQIKALTGVFKTPNGVFFINPSVLQATATNGTVTQVVDLTQPLPPGFRITAIRGASPLGTAPFPGQVFFQDPAGSQGNLPLNFINGPWYYNLNAGLFRNIKIGENKTLQLRMEVFNVLNTEQFFTPSGANANSTGESSGIFDVNSTSFGRITGTFAPRIVQFGVRFDF